ncbi:MAG: helix-turn-helix transcriptional regulator [Chloroflexota bacterium]
MQSGWERRFFSTTRGRLVTLLRRATSTVEELARALNLTDNAVRAHLTTLERDGLVRQGGVRRGPGSGKPAYAYELTAEAEGLFPKAYGELLRQLVHLLGERLEPAELDELLHDLACRLAEGRRQTDGPLGDRVAGAVMLLNGMGGLAEQQPTERGYRIIGCSCPLAAILPGNPQACRLAELLLGEVIGAPVHEQCRREDNPHCEFEISDGISDRR